MLENCAELGPCTNCPYDMVLACVRELSRDAAEIIRQLKKGDNNETTEQEVTAE